MPNTILKRWNGTAFEELYPKTTVGQIAASGTANSTTFLRGDGQWATPTNVDTNNYLTGVSGSGNGTVTFTRQGLSNLTWDASHNHSIGFFNSAITGNLDTLFGTGLFGFANTTTGRPEDYGQGINIINSGTAYNSTDNWITQLAFGTAGSTSYFRTRVNTGAWTAWRKIWNDANDGTGSGLDADLLDGQHGSYFLDTSGSAQTKSGNLTVSATMTAGTATARMFTQSANGVPTSNLGTPTVSEMALFDEQFDNKTAFANITRLSAETSSDGSTWTSFALTDAQKRGLLGGDYGTTINIPYNTTYFRFKLLPGDYVYVNALYCYWSSQGHTTAVQIYKKHDSGSYTQHTSSTNQVSAWPGHLYLPFSTIPWLDGGTLGTHFDEVYVVFIPTWNATYSANSIQINKLQIWGGYPAGKRNVYTTDDSKNVAFPAGLTGTRFTSTVANGTAPLVISSTTAVSNLNADLLDGMHAAAIMGYQSLSEFVDGTLVRTSIDASVLTGDSFTIEIEGKSYSTSAPPFKYLAQGYLYAGNIINYSGLDIGANLGTLKIFEDSGNLCFWWARVSYWNSFKVNVYRTTGADSTPDNTVTAITNSTEPTGTKKVTVNAYQVFSTYHLPTTSEVSGLQTALDLKANLASPTFTGTPTAPTATAGTNTTQIATTAFVSTAVANLINSAPGALDTLDELAAALGDDANFATTITNSIAGKVAKSGDTMTGDLTISSTYPRINLTDTNHNSDYSIINNDGSLGFWDNTNSAYRIHILSSGNVGVGTITPAEPLTVRGNIRSQSPVESTTNIITRAFSDGASTRYGVVEAFRDTVGSLPLLLNPSGGNVGIGTSSPAEILHISGGSGPRIEHTADRALGFVRTGANTFTFEHDTARFYLYNATTAVPAFVISNNGTIGINETSPSAQLQVKSGATNRIPLIVDSLTSHADVLQSWRVNTSQLALVTNGGRFGSVLGFGHTTFANSYVQTPTTGTIISRNIADTNPALIVNLEHASATGNIQVWQHAGNQKVSIDKDGGISAVNLTLSGDLTVNGTTTNINTTNLVVEDKNIILGDVTTPSDTTADGGGITLKGASDKTITWVDSTDHWTSNQVFSAPNFVSTVATGTAPYSATSTTVNTNLNADLLDGNHASAFALDSAVVKLTGAQSVAGVKTFTDRPLADSGLDVGLNTGTISDSITFNTAQAFTGPYLRGSAQVLQRGYYTAQYQIWDAESVPNPTSGTGTANQIAYYTGAQTLGSLSTATYPSLTELSYVKGVTSDIQTQLNKEITKYKATGTSSVSGVTTRTAVTTVTLLANKYYHLDVTGMYSKTSTSGSTAPVINIAVDNTTGTPTINGRFEWLNGSAATAYTVSNTNGAITTSDSARGFTAATATLSAITTTPWGLKALFYTGTSNKVLTFYISSSSTVSGTCAVDNISIHATEVSA